MNIGLWIIQIFLVFAFLVAGLVKVVLPTNKLEDKLGKWVNDFSKCQIKLIGTLEIRKNNPKMPMVIATCPGMVSNGFAESMEHPGGIYTGMDELPQGLTAKRLQLLKAAAPTAKRIALLAATPGTGGYEIQLSEAEKTAAALGIEVKPYRVTSLMQLEKALEDLVKDGMNAILCFQGALTLANNMVFMNGGRRTCYQLLYFK